MEFSVNGGESVGERKWTVSQQDAIASRDKSVAVSAAAGSGKTAVLTRRIIERICAPDGSGSLSRLLVVTFTKAAAAELISRISDALTEELAKNPGNRHLRAQSLLVSSAPISTIHSFCLELIRANFQKLGLPADFSTAEETEVDIMKKRIAEDLISDFFDGTTTSDEGGIADFGHFADTFGDIRNGDRLADTLLSFYETLSSTVGFLDEIETSRKIYERAARNGFDGSFWENSLRRYLVDFLEHYERIYEEAVAYIRENDSYKKYLDNFLYDISYIKEILNLACSGGSYQDLSAAMADYAPKKLPPVTGASGDRKMNFYKNARTEFSGSLRKFAKDFYGYSDEILCETLKESASLLADLSVFLRAFENRFAKEKRRRRIVTFADMERFALSLLWDKENDAPSELALSLRGSFDEIYIDEYQDTNEIQDKIFCLLSRENNRFCVGDIKQSIYSFRGAQPSIFRAELERRPKYEQGSVSPAVKIFLSENFRSTTEILDFCNGIFEKLMNTKTSHYGEEERLRCGSERHGVLPEVCLIPAMSQDAQDADDTEDISASDAEAEYVADRIAELLSGAVHLDGTPVKPSDIVILLRNASKCASSFEKALKKKGIPCRNSGQTAFFESPEVLLILSFLNVIDNPARDIYLAAALKSPLFGVTLAELLYIRRYQRENSLFDALCHFTKETGFAKGEKFLCEREFYAKAAVEMPCDELIWQIYTNTGIFSILSADEERPLYEIEQIRANLMMLYQYARGFERGGFKGLSGFISFINEVIADKKEIGLSQFASPGEVVTIMTIHQSKGLEFPICFVCGLSREFNFKDAQQKALYHTHTGFSMKLISRDGLVRSDTLMRRVASLEMRRLAVEEELRVLYVALTRARERLILTASLKKKKNSGEFQEKGLFFFEGEYGLASRFFSDYDERKANSFLALLLPALSEMQGRFSLVLPKRDEIKTWTEISPRYQEKMCNGSDNGEDISYYEAKKQVAERLDFVYPYRRMSKIPSKLAVSKLYPDVLDDMDGAEMESSVPAAVTMPHFLMREPAEAVTAAERGTAMHTFMQFCDFERVRAFGVETEIDRLIEKQFLFASDKAKMDIARLEAFFMNRIAGEMMAAKRLYREKRFLIKYPISLFSSESEETFEGEELLVQGVIDCAYFNQADELILVDYKTDSFSSSASRTYVENVLKERHTRQLGYYRMACEKLFGILPSHTYLYAFALNDVIEI